MNRRLVLITATASLFGLMLFSGCGGSQRKVSDQPLNYPELTTPQDDGLSSTVVTPTTTIPVPPNATTQEPDSKRTNLDDSGNNEDSNNGMSESGGPAKSRDGAVQAPDRNQDKNDSGQTDQSGTPSGGTPAEKFEVFCHQNPGACE